MFQSIDNENTFKFDSKSYSYLLAKHLKEFQKLNLYNQFALFSEIKDSTIIKDISAQLESFTKV